MLIPVDIRLRLMPNEKADTVAHARLIHVDELRRLVLQHYPHYCSRMKAYSNSKDMDQVTLTLTNERESPFCLKIWESLKD